MKITSITAIPVRVPRIKPMESAASNQPLTFSEFGIVRVRGEHGLEGLGEISMNLGYTGASMCVEANNSLAPVLVGRRANDIRAASIAMGDALMGVEPAKAGI